MKEVNINFLWYVFFQEIKTRLEINNGFAKMGIKRNMYRLHVPDDLIVHM